jgi:hypothetical protein
VSPLSHPPQLTQAVGQPHARHKSVETKESLSHMKIDTLGISVLALLVFGGLYISWQGIQIIQGKRRARIKSYERSLIQTLSVNDQSRLNKILGGLRFIYGLFFIGMGIYFLITALTK